MQKVRFSGSKCHTHMTRIVRHLLDPPCVRNNRIYLIALLLGVLFMLGGCVVDSEYDSIINGCIESKTGMNGLGSWLTDNMDNYTEAQSECHDEYIKAFGGAADG